MPQAPTNNLILLSDTNAAYKLHFFTDKQIIPKTNIIIPKLGKLEFHAIVLEEVEAHITVFKTAKAMGLDFNGLEIPNFFQTVGDAYLDKIYDFVKNNICQIPIVDCHSSEFIQKRKVYEKERLDLQKKWKANGVVGKKVKSTPSLNDYSLLFSAQKQNLKLLTNDEILLAVAEEFLPDGSTFKTEDIINAVYRDDEQKKSLIEDTIGTLESLGEMIIRPRVFK
ncbi:MAG: hypothetical protein ABL930_07015 [Pseudobdellovibrio sp.]